MEMLSAFEATNYAKIAWGLIEKANGRTQDDFDNASEIFKDEVRARYVAADDGDFNDYLEEAVAILEVEWNFGENWKEADAEDDAFPDDLQGQACEALREIYFPGDTAEDLRASARDDAECNPAFGDLILKAGIQQALDDYVTAKFVTDPKFAVAHPQIERPSIEGLQAARLRVLGDKKTYSTAERAQALAWNVEETV
jgi:hypothetical protein